MHPQLEEIMAYMARVRTDLTRLVEQTPPAAFDRKPKNGGWSGTGIIQHVGKVEGSATKLLEGLFAKAMAEGMPAENGTASWLHSFDKLNLLDRTRRINAPERLFPEATAEFVPSWTSLQAVRERLKRALATVDGRDLTLVSAPHPIFGPLNGYQWVLSIGKHEERHLSQLKEVLSEG
jgi:DinB superfamily